MANKSIVIIIDDFSDRTLQYENVTFYDFGDLTITNSHDYFYNADGSFDGYGVGFIDNDHLETLYSNLNDFLRISPNETEYDILNNTFDIDFLNLTDQQDALFNIYGADVFEGVKSSSIARDSYGNLIYDNFGYPYLNTVTNNIIRKDTSSTLEVNHGDWTIEAFTKALNRPELTEIICIDVDTLNGYGSHYSELFKLETSILNPQSQSTNLENIIVDFLQFKGVSFLPDAVNEDSYVISGLSASIAGSMANQEIQTLQFVEDLQAPIIQAAPNVNQGNYDWGSNYSKVINVGAWNKASNQELLLSSPTTIDTIDIVADGYVIKNEWGANFGTSFATPRVTAEIVNVYNDMLYQSNLNEETLPTISESPAIDYDNFVSTFVEYISDPILFDVNGYGTFSFNLLTETINDSGTIIPVSTPVTSGLTGFQANNVRYEEPNKSPTSIALDASSVIENKDGGHIANITGEDPDDDSLTYSVLSGQDSGLVEVDGSTVKFKSGVSADYEQDQSLEFTLRATDPDGLYKDQAFSLYVLDDVSDNSLNLTKEDLALKEQHYGSDLADKMDAGDLLSDLKLHGGKGNDELLGGKGNDELHGGDDNDTLEGKDGNDTLIGGLGNDVLKGGKGNDTLVFEDLDTQVDLHKSYNNKVQDTGHGNDTIDTLSIENIISGSGNDVLKGHSGDNILDGGSGNDILDGRWGNDTLKGGLGNDTLIGSKGIDTLVFGDLDTEVNLGWKNNNKAQDTGHGLDKIDTLKIENITTGSGNDVLIGQKLDNILDGGSGNDTLDGRWGNDVLIGGLGNDTLIGGRDIDTLVFGDLDTTISLQSSKHKKDQDTGHGIDKIYTLGIENITTGSGNDVLTGQWLNNSFDGGSGNDTLIGNNGNDTLKGGLGNDTLIGGSGVDTLVFGDLDTTISLQSSKHNKAQDTGHGLDKIDTLKMENIITGSGNDVLTGQWLDNILDSGSGNDTLIGNKGNDTLIGGLGNDSLQGGLGRDIFRFSSTDGQDTIEDFNVSQGDKIHLMKTDNDSSEVSYTSDGNNTIINWENVSITVNNVQDQDQIAQQIEWMAIV